MRVFTQILSVTVALLTLHAVCMAEESSVAQLLNELQGNSPAQARPAEALDRAYQQVLDSILPALSSDDIRIHQEPQQVLQRMAIHAARPGAETARAVLSKALAGRLPDRPAVAQLWILRQLERIGRKEAVRGEAAMLASSDARVRDAARRALAANPADAAGEALRDALAEAADAAWQRSLIEALAFRQSRADVAVVARYLDRRFDEDVRIAAVNTLGRIGAGESAEMLISAAASESPGIRIAASDACLRLAERLIDTDRPAALRIYRKMLDGGEEQVKSAAILGIGRYGGVDELELITPALASGDRKLRGAAIEAISLMRDPATTTALVRRVSNCDPISRPALLLALASRQDRSTVPVFAQIAAEVDADDDSRVAAFGALAQLADENAVPLLAQTAAQSGAAADAARDALDTLRGEAVDRAVISLSGDSRASVRVVVARSLGQRRSAGAVPVLLRMGKDTDAGVRFESIKSLGILAEGDVLTEVVQMIVAAQSERERDEAASATVAIARRTEDKVRRAEAVLAAISSSQGPVRSSLLGVLGRLGGTAALDAVLTDLKNSDPAVAEAAFRALVDWPEFAAALHLLKLASDSPAEAQRILALRGYLRLIAASDLQAQEKVDAIASGLAVTQRADERRQAMGALGSIRHIASLRLAAKSLSDEQILEEAAAAIVRIARELREGPTEEISAILAQVQKVSKNESTLKQAGEIAARL